LQLGLTEAYHLGSVVLQEIVDDLLFGLLVETSDIEGDESELLPIGFHFREISLNPRFIFVGGCISPVFSVVCSTPTVTLTFVLGLLLPRCYLLFHILGGSSPTITTGFWLGHLSLLSHSLDFCHILHLLCLTGCRWHFRGSCFRSPLLLSRCPKVLLSRFADSVSGVLLGCPILFGPCNPFFDSRMLAVLAWVSR
jgi:hypothetical protein